MTTKASQLKSQHHRKQRGFSLIEVLIGLIFLSVGLLAMASLQTLSIFGNFNSQNLTQATYALQDRLEILKSVPFDSALLKEGEHDDGTVTLSGIGFQRTYTIVTNGDLKTIQYGVSWNDGTPHRIAFSTVRCQ